METNCKMVPVEKSLCDSKNTARVFVLVPVEKKSLWLQKYCESFCVKNSYGKKEN